ncbi:MAG TPA: undecaprenyl-diphosphate phosphatase [Bacillota bacterium]|nr:undecaprenyl-diphosphate phosphatase [Bacillota bacterium]
MLPASWLVGAGGTWLAAVHNPSAHTVVSEAMRASRGLLRVVFWKNPFSTGPVDALHALIAGCIAGLSQGLPIGDLGQSFAWPYLLQWPGAALPGTAPALRTACLLGAACGLGVALRTEWAALWARARAGTPPGDPGGAPPPPDLGVLLLAAVPSFLLCWLLRHLTTQLLAAATVGVCLLITAQTLGLAQRWARQDTGPHTAVPPWLAAVAGVTAGLAALPGVSGLAVILAVLLYGRILPEASGTFALMAATIVAALLGVVSLPTAAAAASAALLPALVGAAAGAYAGGRLLRRWLGPARARVWPILAGYCAAVGGLMLLFGVFAG